MLQTLLQALDALLGLPFGFDVVADCLERYVEARKYINSMKIA